MIIHAIPALETNYFWLLQPNSASLNVYILDPGDHKPIIEIITQKQLKLQGIIITHHHWDHTDGIDALLQYYPVPVYGPDSDKILQITQTLHGGGRLVLPELTLEVIATPGHTLDHIAYLYRNELGPDYLFSADNIFAAGCGRLFEGTPAQFFLTLQSLAALPQETLVYCSHEYTLNNLAFAKILEPNNQGIVARIEDAKRKRALNIPTIPTTIALELATNPFLRCHTPAVKQAAEAHFKTSFSNEVAVFAAIREWKNTV